jgi:predicted CXXCH cytochrome family protein
VINPIKTRPARFLTMPVSMLFVLVGAAQMLPGPAGTSQSAAVSEKTYPAPVNLKVLPGNLSGRQVHDLMEKWSGELGVRCVECHVFESDATASGVSSPRFADDSKPMKGIARQMYTMTEAINSSYIRNVNGETRPVTCGTCHQGHVTPEPFFAPSDPQVCSNCHAAVAGPFRFEHAVIKAEGCTACHVLHGGAANPHLLIRADVDAVCQQCHLPSPDPATGAHMQAPDNRRSDVPTCIGCHVDIHGSNLSPVFLRTR